MVAWSADANLAGLKLSVEPQVRTGNYDTDMTLMPQITAMKQANEVCALRIGELSKYEIL